jgi:hypothetical protein
MAINISFAKQQMDVPYFLELQRRLLEVFRFVSCHERNFATYSLVLESLLIDGGSFFDSLCQSYIREVHHPATHLRLR